MNSHVPSYRPVLVIEGVERKPYRNQPMTRHQAHMWAGREIGRSFALLSEGKPLVVELRLEFTDEVLKQKFPHHPGRTCACDICCFKY